MGTEAKRVGCADCLEGAGLDFDFTMAFQPIVRVSTRSTYAYEALVRGRNRESAGHILSLVNVQNRYRFDQACRVKAIELASRLGLTSREGQLLHINFLPGAVYRPETCIRATSRPRSVSLYLSSASFSRSPKGSGSKTLAI